jgi:glycosyltransferase involved in cell wall biosynthesis
MKGVEVALRAFSGLRSPRARLELYGSHKRSAEYERLAVELGIGGSVRFLGYVPNIELPGRLAGADLLLHPTPSESFGQVLAEAAALGVPAVASRVNAVPEVIEDGKTGLLCPTGDVAAFTRALSLLLADSPMRLELGRNARDRATSHWRWEVVARRFEEEIYRPLVLHRRGRAGSPASS